MEKIVFGRIDIIDFRTGLKKVNVLESLEDLPKVHDNETIIVTTDTEENLNIAVKRSSQMYLPSTKLTTENQDVDGLHVYFDLENYPFYQKVKEIIAKEDMTKGVFRYRRMVKRDAGSSLLTSDMYAISLLLGKPVDIKVKQTDSKVTPWHIVIMINLGEGKMAHIEYTVTNQERIELEWSGIKKIIEFDSDEMRPIRPTNNSKLPLSYSVDSIVDFGHKVDESLINCLNDFNEIINGGRPK